ncbi:MAG TPA: dTMP kinase [Candidatus Dormibacteraeota bacterium]|nr:dTMP kinase [Candidatus Dormibacteraeota bacterium]
MFVTVEGVEGAGKSTLVAGLASALRRRGVDPVVTREPGGTPLGERVRALFLDPEAAIDPLAEALLMAASRAQLVRSVIRPALARGTLVLCDRFWDASVAYQGYGRRLGADVVIELNRIATEGINPDLTLLLEVPEDEARRRMRARSGDLDRMELESEAFHRRVAEGYAALAERFAERFVVLDAREAPETLVSAAVAAIERRGGVLPGAAR